MSETGETSGAAETAESSENTETAETSTVSDIDSIEKSIDTDSNVSEADEKETAETENLRETYGDTTETKENYDGTVDEDFGFQENIGLTDEQKAEIQAETGWSDKIIDNIRSPEEADIYKNVGLTELKIDGKECLIKEDLEFDTPDEYGVTNGMRINDGNAPHNADGEVIYVHHIGQHADSPFAELTFAEHRQGGNDTILHDKNMETEVHGDDNRWTKERREYWKQRLDEYDKHKEEQK